MLRKAWPDKPREGFADRIRRHANTIERTTTLTDAQRAIALCAVVSTDRQMYERDGVLRFRRSDLLRLLKRIRW